MRQRELPGCLAGFPAPVKYPPLLLALLSTSGRDLCAGDHSWPPVCARKAPMQPGCSSTRAAGLRFGRWRRRPAAAPKRVVKWLQPPPANLTCRRHWRASKLDFAVCAQGKTNRTLHDRAAGRAHSWAASITRQPPTPPARRPEISGAASGSDIRTKGPLHLRPL